MSASAREISSALLNRPPPPLSPTKPFDPSLSTRIAKLKDPVPLKAALYLANDDIHNAHESAQSREGDPMADHVHQQVHRREKDFWNSKWWLGTMSRSSTGPSPAFLSTHGTIAQGKAFVDACAAARSAGAEREELEAKQWEEIRETVRLALEDAGSES